MSIQFNRQNVQQFWQQKGQASSTPLCTPLADNKLTRQEYQDLRQQFESENPGQDFDRWLADALDGQLDQQANPKLLASIRSLGQAGSAVSSVSFANPEQQGGYTDHAVHYQQDDWLQAVQAADKNRDGRIEPVELQHLQSRLPADLMQKLRQEGAVLTYDSAQKTLSFYPAPEAPTLHGRYKDLKLELDLDLKDIDGVTDRSRNDLTGQASGSLHFDWRGPLVAGLRQAMQESTGGWVDLNARYAPAGQEYGPGYVIQAQSGILATRPIVIKNDAQGQLYLESPGFGETARLWLGEKGLNKYALPQLKAMGLDLQIEKKDGKIYLRPQTLEVNNLPLSAQGEGGGQLNLGLKNRTRFSVGADGLRAHFDKVPAQGSSDVKGRQAVADTDAQGQARPDRIQGRVQAGLNYDVKKSEIDTQVVLQGVEAELNLERQELAKLSYLTPELLELAGQELQGRLRLQGTYRTVNGKEHQGQIQGQIALTRQQGADKTDIFARFRSEPLNPRQTSLSVSLSAVDVRHQKPQQAIKVQATAGQIQVGAAKPAQIRLQNTQAEAQVSGPLLERTRKILNLAQPGSVQLNNLLKALGVNENQLSTLTQGSSEQIQELMSSQAFVQKLEQALVRLEAQQLEINQTENGFSFQADKVGVSGEAGDQQGTQLRFQGQAAQAAGKVQAGALEAQVTRSEAELHLERNQAEGTLDGTVQVKAEQLELKDGSETQVRLRQGEVSGRFEGRSAQGTQVEVKGDMAGLELDVQGKRIELDAGQTRAELKYQSPAGSEIQVNTTAGSLHLNQVADGNWKLSVPDLDSYLRLDLDLGELRKLSEKLGKEQLARLQSTSTLAEVEAVLKEAGLPPAQARQASNLMQKPELQALLNSSELMDALKQGKRIELELRSQGDLEIDHASTAALSITSQSQVEASAGLKNADGETMLTAAAQSDIELAYAGQTLQASTPELRLSAQGLTPDGRPFAALQLRSQDLNAQMGAQEQSLSTGQSEASLNFKTQLDAEKIKHIQTLLTDFKDELVTRLSELGLSRQQFEQVLQAFGQKQLDALFKAATPDTLANVSENLGLSPDQIEKTLGLLNDEPFQKLVQNLFAYSSLLNNAEADIRLSGQTSASQWSRNDQGLLMNLQGITARLEADTHNDQGRGQFSAELQQEALRYTDSQSKQALEWQPLTATASADLRPHDGQEQLQVELQGSAGQGAYSQEQGMIRSQVEHLRLHGEMKQTSETGLSATATGQLALDQVNTKRERGNADSARLKLEGLTVEAQGEMTDPEAQQRFDGEGAVSMKKVQVSPRGIRATETDMSARIRTERELDKNQRGEAEAAFNLQAENIRSSDEQGVRLAEAQFEGHAESTLKDGDKVRTRLRVEANQGQLQNLQAQEGKVTLEQMQAQVRTDLQTPMVRGRVEGQLQVDEFVSIEGEEARAKGFQIDTINGKLHLDTTRLRDIVSGNPDALAILNTVSEKWASRQRSQDTPNIFLNPAITLDISQGTWKGDAKDGNALSQGQTLTGHLSFPDLHTQLGTGSIDLQLHNLSLAEAGARPEVEITGKARLQPKQPEFNQSVQSLVEFSLKGAGIDLKPTVSFENGEFKIKIDRWYVDGLISIDFEGGDINVSVDRAKLLGFISARGLAGRYSESQLNNYLLDIERQGSQLKLSLSEFSERLLHKDNLQIKAVHTRPDNSIEMDFGYTDTQSYNAGFRQRQQQRLDQRLFHNPAKNGEARSSRQLGSVVKDLEAGRLALVFQQASPSQLRQLIASVGNDYDDIVRKVLAKEPTLSKYPLENKALMAATLADNSGFFESVDSGEKAWIRKLLDSVPAAQQARFEASLTEPERQRLHKVLGTTPAPVRQPSANARRPGSRR